MEKSCKVSCKTIHTAVGGTWRTWKEPLQTQGELESRIEPMIFLQEGGSAHHYTPLSLPEEHFKKYFPAVCSHIK